MKLTRDEALAIINNENPDWVAETQRDSLGNSWFIKVRQIYKHDGQYYKFVWEEGYTKAQTDPPWFGQEYVTIEEAFPIVVTKWFTDEDDNDPYYQHAELLKELQYETDRTRS